jgi:hypothetical protein
MTHIARPSALALTEALFELLGANAERTPPDGWTALLSPSDAKRLKDQHETRFNKAIDAYETAVIGSLSAPRHTYQVIDISSAYPNVPVNHYDFRRNRVDGCDHECVGDDFPRVEVQVAQAINYVKTKLPHGDDAIIYAGHELYEFLRENSGIAIQTRVIRNLHFEPTVGRMELTDGRDCAWISLSLCPVGERPNGKTKP